MSKKVIEFTDSNTKSNQQTASKVDCQIIVNNGVKDKRKKSTKEKLSAGERKVSIIDDVQVYKGSSDASEISEVENEEVSTEEETKSLKVKVPVNRSVDMHQSSASRFYVTARNPAVLREEILQSIPVKDELIRIFANILCQNDKILMANLLDRSGKIIINAEDFANLVALMLSSSGQEVKPSDIKINYREEYITSCLKVRISPFKSVVSITIGDQDFKIHQFEAYNVLTNDFNVSADSIYFPIGKVTE